ncbi:MAG: SseB family protein [Microbacterium sp.]
MSDEPPQPIPSAASADVGSARLAAALAAGDPVAIGRALRQDFVVVPLMRGPQGETQTRVVAAEDPDGERRWLLPLFSSSQTFAAWVGDAPDAGEFALQRGGGLAPLLDAYGPLLRRVVFDAAGPHPVQASPEDVRASLEPQPGDDEVGWITQPPGAGLAEGERVSGLDLFLDDGWATIDLSSPASIDDDVAALVDAQLRGVPRAPVLRGQLTAWLRQSSRTAASAGGRMMAYLTRRTEDAAASVAVTQYWQQLGPAPEGGHLAALAARLDAGTGAQDELVEATTATGRLLRMTSRRLGPAELAGRPVGVVDYWLEMPDGQGLCLVSFSTPHVEQFADVQHLADAIVLAAAWELAPHDDAAGTADA